MFIDSVRILVWNHATKIGTYIVPSTVSIRYAYC